MQSAENYLDLLELDFCKIDDFLQMGSYQKLCAFCNSVGVINIQSAPHAKLSHCIVALL